MLLFLLILDYFLILGSILFVPFRERLKGSWPALGLIGALIAVQASSAWWLLGDIHTWPDPEMAIFCYFLYVFFSAMLLIAVLWRVLGIRQIRKGGQRRPPFSYRWLGHVHLAITVLIGALAIGGGYPVGQGMVIGLVFLGTIAFGFYQQAKNYDRAEIREVLEDSGKAPVLYLRSFKTENIGFWSGPSSQIRPYINDLSKTNTLLAFQSLTFAEYFGDTFTQKIGPFIMLGNPHDFMPLSGGATDYYQDDNWKQHVHDYLQRSVAVVMPVGRSGNLAWELRQIRDKGYAGKLFILTEPVQSKALGALSGFFKTLFGTRGISWNDFVQELQALGFVLPAQDPGPGAVIGFDAEGQAKILQTGARLPVEYAGAILSTIQGG